MKKVYLVGVCILIVALFAGIFGCATPASEQERTRITLGTGRPGDAWTVMTYALGSFINEDSQLIKTSVLTTGGTGDSRKILLEDTVKRATQTGIGLPSVAEAELSEKGAFPLFIGMITPASYLWITYDENIKTLEDFAGKVIAGPRQTTYGWFEQFSVPLELAGVLDKVEIQSGGIAGGLTKLIDGTVDIAMVNCDAIYPDIIQPGSRIEQAQAKAPVYFPDWGKERIEVQASEKIGFQLTSVEVPPESLGPTQKDTIYILSDPLFWGAHMDMDEDIVYEIAKILYDHAGKGDFAGYHNIGKGLVPEFVPYGPWKTKEDIEKWYHPGALKYYREAGVPGL